MSTTEVITRKFMDTPPASQADAPPVEEMLVFRLSGREVTEVQRGEQFMLVNRKRFDRWRVDMLVFALIGMVLSGAVGALVASFIFRAS